MNLLDLWHWFSSDTGLMAVVAQNDGCGALRGALPLALGSGAGSELRAPVGVALVYLYLDRLRQRLKPRGVSRPATATQTT